MPNFDINNIARNKLGRDLSSSELASINKQVGSVQGGDAAVVSAIEKAALSLKETSSKTDTDKERGVTNTDPTNTSPVTSTENTRADLTSELNASLSLIDQERAAAEQKRQQRISEIEADAAAEQATTEQKQKNQTGARTLFLAGAGALGRTGAAQQNLVALEKAHTAEIAAIQARKQRLINAANAAYEDKDFNLLKAKIEEIRAVRREEQELEEKLENRKIKMAQEARAQANFEMKVIDRETEQQKETAAGIAAGLISESSEIPSEGDLLALSEQYGIDPLYLLQAVDERKEAIRKIEVTAFKDYFNIAKQLQKGEEVEAPDGTIIRGIKNADIITYEAKIGGMKYKVGANKDTGEVLWRNEVGYSGGSGSGKTVTWSMAKELGDLSLYGQPVGEIYKTPEALTFEDWLTMKNSQDPENYPLMSPLEGDERNDGMIGEYFDYMDSIKSPAQKYEEEQEDEEASQPDEQYGIEIAQANQQLVADGQQSEEELVVYIMEQANLSRSKATSIVKQFVQ